MTPSTSQITGLVLAGGRGSRMGGVDKGLQPLNGMPMIKHVIERLSPQVGALMINANQNLERYRAFGLPLWPDQLTGFAGPLAGLHTGLMHCATDYLVTAPCDSPFLPPDLVARLRAALAAQEANLAVAATEENGTRRLHPVFCLMHVSVLPSLTAYLDDGGRKFETWCRSLRLADVPFPDEAAFRNINTVEELRRFENP
ncbi:molybdenum cofactor guanylyltransferase MobA [Noviherbaspirillum autotrophicum]|uniref:Molybdenum cofactor guanylyltransferase n=1 Tax=Noviherbaspirillum autotrophicum TaxID=709839 RepID=A0A0C1YI09_9BURK|nr:molybdenum cofactor guanylyltransferase MobA [Noviherbaspirillum autotrophicum]KIF80167.1 molybdopterin-guanine dinucleotide biosynthesis protein A [Noviherbaspirillum autotrophicum]